MVKYRVGLLAVALLLSLLQVPANAQSTATLQGSITDATNSAVPNADISIRNTATGEERRGLYLKADKLFLGLSRVAQVDYKPRHTDSESPA